MTNISRIAALFCLGVVLPGAQTYSQTSASSAVGTLTFSPARPKARAKVSVSYKPIATLSTEQSLILRGHFRRPQDEMYNSSVRRENVATLTRDATGVFRGSFEIPDSAVYASFAVENAAATMIDANASRFWELTVHGRDGQPLYDALEQRAADFSGRDWMESYKSMRKATTLHPEIVNGWYLLQFFERIALGDTRADSAKVGHRTRMRTLHEQFAGRRGLSPKLIADLYQFANAVGDTTAEKFWRERMFKEASKTRAAAQARGLQTIVGYYQKKTGKAALDSFERYWPDAKGTHSQLPEFALDIAVQEKDSVAVDRWIERLLEEEGPGAGIAYRAARLPERRERALEIMRTVMSKAQNEDPGVRPLDETRAQREKAAAKQLAFRLTDFGSLLIKAGHVREGIDTLKLATATVLDPEIYETLAKAQLSLGDTAGATVSFAMVAADAGTSAAQRDSIRAQLGFGVDDPRWTAQLDSAAEKLLPRVLADTVRWTPKRSELADATGRTTPLQKITAGKPTVLVFWNRGCGPCLQEMPNVEKLFRKLKEAGVGLISITDDPPSDDLTKFIASKGVTYPVYYDTNREAALAFNVSGIPAHFVLDSAGQVRFALSQLSKIAQQLNALRKLEQPAGGTR
jgi:peroxiredoxin